MSRADRRARERETVTDEEPQAEQTCGWALKRTTAGWTWVRLLLPAAAVERYQVGEYSVPDLKQIAVARIEADMVSDRVVDRRGWTR